MGLNRAGGILTMPTSTGNFSVTSLLFTPKLVLFWGVGLARGVIVTAATISYGVATSATSRWAFSETIFATTQAAQKFTHTKCFVYAFESPVSNVFTYCDFDFVSMNANGFTINVTTTDVSIATEVGWLALGGTDLDVAVGYFDSGTSLANVSVTGLAFQPKATLLFTASTPTADDVGEFKARVGAGASISSSQRFFTSMAAARTDPSDASSVFSTSKAISYIVAPEVTDLAADFVSMNSDGFTINLTTFGGGASELRIPYVALGGSAQYALGTFNGATATGTQTPVTGLSFRPGVGFLLSDAKVSGAASPIAQHMFSAFTEVPGAPSVRVHNSMYGGTDDNIAAFLGPYARELVPDAFSFLTQGSSTVKANASLLGTTADGFQLSWAVADATARQIGYLVIGDAPTSKPWIYRRHTNTLVAGFGRAAQ